MTASESSVRIGLLACGERIRKVCRDLLAEAGGRIRVAAIYDPDPESRAAALAESGAVVCGSEEELVTRPDVDWVFVGSPNGHHARQSTLALRAGKDVFCEKPLATSLKECLAVRDVVRETGRRFSFGLVLRYSPHYRKVHELVSSGVIGDLISFEFNETLVFNLGGYIFGNWRRKRSEAGTYLLEKCCHDLDLANWIVGSRARRVAGFGGRDFFVPANERHIARIGPDAAGRPAYQSFPDRHRVNPFSPGADIFDNQVAILEYENGVRATFHTNCNSGIPERRFYLNGTEGALRADAITGLIEWQRISHEPKRETILHPASDGHAGGDEAMARGLVRTLLHGEPPLATVDDGTLAVFTASLIDRATDEGVVVNASDFPME